MVLGATFRGFVELLGPIEDAGLGPEKESEVPLRSHGTLSMNRALMAAGSSTASR